MHAKIIKYKVTRPLNWAFSIKSKLKYQVNRRKQEADAS